MLGLTNYISTLPWVDVFTIWYVLVDDAYQAIVRHRGRRWRRRGPEPTFSDSEVITVSLILSSYFQQREELGLAFVRQYHADLFPRLPAESQFNRRRRALSGVMESLRQQLTTRLISPDDRVRLIDSAPIPACTYTRNDRCATVSGTEYMGLMVSKRAKLFGHRLYATTTTDQVIDRWMLAPAAARDGKLLPAFFEDQRQLLVLGDNAFHAPTEIHQLQDRQITVLAAQRRDFRNQWSADVRRFFNRLRRRIETAFSVLTTVFHLETPGSRCLSGLLCRLTSSLLAYNLSFLVNIELAAMETHN